MTNITAIRQLQDACATYEKEVKRQRAAIAKQAAEIARLKEDLADVNRLTGEALEAWANNGEGLLEAMRKLDARLTPLAAIDEVCP